MIHDKWFISDTHFFHTNIIKFVDDQGHRIRPFNSLEEMHETIVERWNGLVKPNDFVYHLGDVTFQYHKPFQELMYRFKGKKRLIVGNHDKLKQEGLLKHFDKVVFWHGFREEDFTASHMPLRLDSLRDGHFNVHGHTHQNSLEDTHYINVCVEVRDYYPVHLDTILKEIKEAKRLLVNFSSPTRKTRKEKNMTEEINVEQATVEKIPEFLRRVDENGNPIPVAVQTPEDTGEHDTRVN